MYHYELHRLDVAELVRRADRERLLREAVLARRAARRARRDDTEGRVDGDPDRFARAA